MLDATFQIRLGDVGRTWEVRTRGRAVRGSALPDARTRRRDRQRRLDLDRAARGAALGARRLLAASPLCPRRPRFGARLRGPLQAPRRARPAAADRPRSRPAGRGSRALIAGHGADQVLCLHGLGSNKASFFETVAALAGECTVHALDLPGFGASEKPARAPYDAAWFAEAVLGYLDAMTIDSAHLVGNSMGGRIALEAGLDGPRSDRVAESPRAGAGVPPPSLARTARAAAAARARGDPASASRAPGPKPAPGSVRRPGAPRSRRGRCRRRGFLPYLPLTHRQGGVLRRGSEHLPRRAQRRRGFYAGWRDSSHPRCSSGATPNARSLPASPATSARPAGGAPGRARGLRARAAGRAAEDGQPADRRADRRGGEPPSRALRSAGALRRAG